MRVEGVSLLDSVVAPTLPSPSFPLFLEKGKAGKSWAHHTDHGQGYGSRSGGGGGLGYGRNKKSNVTGRPAVDGAVGLTNLGNTCYMNSGVCCVLCAVCCVLCAVCPSLPLTHTHSLHCVPLSPLNTHAQPSPHPSSLQSPNV